MYSDYKTISFIGSGFSANAILFHLNQLIQSPLDLGISIELFDKRGHFGDGVSYDVNNDVVLLNRPTSHMSIDYANPQHFAEWLHAQNQPINEYETRKNFGLYLTAVFRTTVQELMRKNVKINLISHEVQTISHIDEKYINQTQDRTHYADIVVISTGNNLQNNIFNIDAHELYINNLYSEFSRITQIVKSDMQNILIIGSSLSSIDVILTLQKTGYNGNIYCLSRNGYLPKPRLSTKLIELNHIPKLTQLNNISLSQLVRYFNQECTSVSAGLSWKHFFLNATRIDKNALSAALVHQEDHIQQILTSTNPYVEEIWQKLSCTAQQFIIDKMFTCYMNQRNPMPKSSAVALLGLLQDNKLHWIKEKISSIIQTNNEYLVTDCIGNEKRFGFIVNATGQSKDIASNPLYKDLLNKNMISKNFIGGLNVDCTTQNIIDADGNPIPTLFGIGPKTLGTYININSAEMLSKKAHSIACSLAKLTQL